jgi:hypothetical protein
MRPNLLVGGAAHGGITSCSAVVGLQFGPMCTSHSGEALNLNPHQVEGKGRGCSHDLFLGVMGRQRSGLPLTSADAGTPLYVQGNASSAGPQAQSETSAASTAPSTPEEEQSDCAMSAEVSALASAHNAEPISDIGVSKTRKGIAYDLATVDDKLKKRLIKNRLSAERSRQRKAAELESLQAENAQLRAEKAEMAAKMQRMAELMAAHGLSLE